jgi:hypothetical protein
MKSLSIPDAALSIGLFVGVDELLEGIVSFLFTFEPLVGILFIAESGVKRLELEDPSNIDGFPLLHLSDDFREATHRLTQFGAEGRLIK